MENLEGKKEGEVKETKLFCPLCKKEFDEHDSIETGKCPRCGRKPSEATMEVSAKIKEETAKLVAEKGVGKTCVCGLVSEKGRVTCRLCGKPLMREKSPGKEKSNSKEVKKDMKKKEKKAKKATQKGKKVQRKLKYPFDSLTGKGQSFSVPHSEGKAGKVTVYENIQILAREYGMRHDVKLEVKEEAGKKVLVTRIS